MKRIYTAKRIQDGVIPDDAVWQSVPAAEISNYPWDTEGYKPRAEAKVCYNSSHIHVMLKAYESKLKVTYWNNNEHVYKDSCLEFFIRPNPGKDERYMNFEMNPVGTLLLGLGKDRYNREKPDINGSLELLNIKTSVKREEPVKYNGEWWSIQYSIPVSYLERYFGNLELKPGNVMEANFYKCGDETEYPHYGCWNNIDIENPDFHRPEFFGQLILE